MEDSRIVDLYWERNEDAIKETDKKYGNYCFSCAFNILFDRQDAQECVNDTWLKAWNLMPDERPSMLKYFLAKITRGFALNLYRKNSAEKRGSNETEAALSELENVLSSGSDPEQEMFAKDLQSAINSFLYRLTEKERNVFIRRYFYMENTNMIAEKYHMTENNVSVVLNRARKKLRQYLMKEGYL